MIYFCGRKMKETIVGQMALDTLGNDPGSIITSVQGTLPGVTKGNHHMTADTVAIFIARGQHIA